MLPAPAAGEWGFPPRKGLRHKVRPSHPQTQHHPRRRRPLTAHRSVAWSEGKGEELSNPRAAGLWNGGGEAAAAAAVASDLADAALAVDALGSCQVRTVLHGGGGGWGGGKREGGKESACGGR